MRFFVFVFFIFFILRSAFADLTYTPTLVDVTTSGDVAAVSSGDQVVVTGGGVFETTFILTFPAQVSATGAFQLYVSGLAGTPEISSFEIWDSEGVTFDDFRLLNLPLVAGLNEFSFAGATYDQVILVISGGATSAFTVDSESIVIAIDEIASPEPGTFALFGLGALALWWMLRRSRRGAQPRRKRRRKEQL